FHQIWNARTNVGVEIILRDNASARRVLQPFRQCRLSRSEHRRDRQFAPITALLAQPTEMTGADSFQRARQRQSAPPAIVLADQGNAQGHIFCRRPWLPFVARVQHFRYTAPDESRALICYPETTRARTGFERVLHAERHLLYAEQRTSQLHAGGERLF